MTSRIFFAYMPSLPIQRQLYVYIYIPLWLSGKCVFSRTKKGGLKVGHVWSCWSGFQIPPLNQLFLLPSVLFEDDKLTFAYAKLSEDVMPDKPITLWWLVQRCKPFMVCRYCKWLGRLHVSFGSVLEIAWLIWLRVVVAHIISSMFSHSF